MAETPIKQPHFGCPVQATSSVLAGKWKVQIVWKLSFAERRFSELRDSLAGITEKVLTSQLRQLAADGVIRRTSSEHVPPHVTYSLTESGMELVTVMEAMCGWGAKHFGIEPTLRRDAAAAP